MLLAAELIHVMNCSPYIRGESIRLIGWHRLWVSVCMCFYLRLRLTTELGKVVCAMVSKCLWVGEKTTWVELDFQPAVFNVRHIHQGCEASRQNTFQDHACRVSLHGLSFSNRQNPSHVWRWEKKQQPGTTMFMGMKIGIKTIEINKTSPFFSWMGSVCPIQES